ncbi:hypothetical protein EST38_g12612 [Candolleomyces aberdarensis]|uniref:Endonuclease/exonuclease/phosphatase domain-containing protein n=1 Tax=Candolleomyces aberdarensis TaxID=2316362 RepID=A0A4Q2D480_9AGAR|nr:hypothetical protein EST38_g12612 [Candolleomyces aberdarensis]
MGLDKDYQEIKTMVQETIARMNGTELIVVRSVVQDLKRAKMTIEISTNKGVDWLKREDRAAIMATQLGASLKERRFPVIVQFTLVTFDPERDLPEMAETNGIAEEQLLNARWIKPIGRRNQHQRAAHLILELKTAEAANDVIARGIIIHGARLYAIKCKREPIRCLKCHRHHPLWDHDEDNRLFTKDALTKAENLIHLMADWNMAMALPKGIRTLRHFRSKQQSRPDNVFCTDITTDIIIKCNIAPDLKPVLTDHTPIAIVLNISKIPAPETEFKNFRMTD